MFRTSFQTLIRFLCAHPVQVRASPDAATPEAVPPEEQEGGASGEESDTAHREREKKKTELVIKRQNDNLENLC